MIVVVVLLPPDWVLIVPSGIETSRRFLSSSLLKVLIVPSGIETLLNMSLSYVFSSVLIVPSGIETCIHCYVPFICP